MHKLVFALVAVGVAVLALIGVSALPVHADPVAVTAAMPEPSAVVVAEPAPPSAEDLEHAKFEEEMRLARIARHDHLKEYTLGVMQGWTHAVASLPVADYESIADDITQAVILEPDPPAPMVGCGLMPGSDGFRRCLWGVDGWNSDHAKTVMLAALGYWEGARYALYVDELSCNEKTWLDDPANAALIHRGGNCDHGHAHSIWQIHPIVDVSSPIYPLCNVDAVDGSRLGAARCALELARRSMMSNNTLSGYTGEWGFEHPKADLRLDFAWRALNTHPFGVH